MRNWCRSYGLLLKWHVLQLRTELPVFVAIQSLIAAGIVLGSSLVIPHIDAESALYLTTGAMTISLVTVGMVVTPQHVAMRRERGMLDYQRSMPVPRLAMLAADATVWVVVALPGLVRVLAVAAVRCRS